MDTPGVRVIVPAHMTGFFSVHRDPDPLASGSRGGGLTLSDGVEVRVRRASTPSVRIDGTTTSVAAVDGVIEALGQTPAIDVRSAVPIGAGFGVSGAMALGTAIGVNHVYGCDRSENDLLRIAHAAEVRAGTGFGDVVAQHRGGVPIRLEPGAPGFGRVDGIADRQPVEYVSFGDLSTESVLAGDLATINRAGAKALSAVQQESTLEGFMRAAHAFTRASDLETPRVREAIDAVDAAGGVAAMAMLGRTVFALGSDLSDAGYDARRCEIANGGVRLRPSSEST